MKNKSILLISFYNRKSLGVRFLERALHNAGIKTGIVFLKDYNSKKPTDITEKELSLLNKLIRRCNPSLIGLSIMTSLYLDNVAIVSDMLRNNHPSIPIVLGGTIPTMFPKKCLEKADFVIRGEGEKAIVKLFHAISRSEAFSDISNLVYKKNDDIKMNPMETLEQNLDIYEYPILGKNNKFLINNDQLLVGDPITKSYSYELIASRGCPFHCSYCCSSKLRRIYGKKANVRFRSVNSVIEELIEAKTKLKNLKVIRFWDEIFSNSKTWVDEFCQRYKKEINLPFEIWAHPLVMNEGLISRLVDAGLYKVVMGIQSGSPYIRKKIFNRPESQEAIIRASNVLSKCKVPHVVYDFILEHPFETEETIKETYFLCTRLHSPFELQLHGLSFLPGTDIVKKALEMKVISQDTLKKLMYGTMKEQYQSYWNQKKLNIRLHFWYALIYMCQFKLGKLLAKYFSNRVSFYMNPTFTKIVLKLFKYISRIKNYYRKVVLMAFSIPQNNFPINKSI